MISGPGHLCESRVCLVFGIGRFEYGVWSNGILLMSVYMYVSTLELDQSVTSSSYASTLARAWIHDCRWT